MIWNCHFERDSFVWMKWTSLCLVHTIWRRRLSFDAGASLLMQAPLFWCRRLSFDAGASLLTQAPLSCCRRLSLVAGASLLMQAPLFRRRRLSFDADASLSTIVIFCRKVIVFQLSWKYIYSPLNEIVIKCNSFYRMWQIFYIYSKMRYAVDCKKNKTGRYI